MAERHIPCLDGLRAMSLSLVLVWHYAHAAGRPLESFLPIGDVANLGVRMFFVISGFLITSLLMTELDRTGRISLSQFYLRRSFRIFPAFYLYVAVIALASRSGFLQLEPGDLPAAVTYTVNYHAPRSWSVGHIWSLSVEEQFYLLWPAIMVLFGKRGGLWAAVLAIAAAPLIRVLTLKFLPSQRIFIGESFQTVADSLATGCALALLRHRIDGTAWLVRLQKREVSPWIYVAIALAANAAHRHVSFGYTVGETICNVCLALMVDACVRNPRTVMGRFLERRPLVFMGTLSYSIYLWQQPLLDAHRKPPFMSLPLNLLVIAGLSLLCYYGVEKPMLEVRKRFTRRAAKPEPA